MSTRFVEPVAPYTSAIPYRKKAEAKAPSTKYFTPASCEDTLRRCIAART